MNHPTREVGLADVGVMTDLATAAAPRRLSVVRLARMSPTRSVERGTARLAGTLPWSARRASHYALGTGRPNHWVEVNRHQPPCLPGRLDSLIATLHSHVHGQMAVTHPGRWTYVHDAAANSESERR